VEDLKDVCRRGGRGGGPDPGLSIVHGSIELCGAAKTVIRAPDQGRVRSTATDTERAMQHFDVGNRHQIKDAPPNTWATVHCRDVVTMSELSRRGFHLIDMSGEIWTMHRES
jgi:hypothetical protein